ncbi:geranylgeranyl transferase type-1 subunit beta-like isoform X1 [Neltuma alba]|uniref:geranylgeranyl transferase type-1 subunit beta-like isoform X1 n=1 Tax=Neltuma alba TaxID=207710 RepID=UPI0010A38A2F|nr:geranylgeranyl transferase type-1 subunit beta-like isoform X1 [Prosopis alba]
MESVENSSEGLPSSPSSHLSAIFDRDRHITLLQMMYQLLPSPYQLQEINRLTLAYFVISGLDILGALDRVDKDAVANWVLSLQVHHRNQADRNSGQFFGFLGSRTSQFPQVDNGVSLPNNSHLASTYCALAILKIVGYKLSNNDFESVLTSMRNLQQPDGSFMPIHTGAEKDLRFIYCAAAISFMLNDWSGMDKEKAKDYILRCQSYDGGFGLVPGAESHGGATYCAIASLRFMGFLEDDLLSSSAMSPVIDVPLLLDWLVQRLGTDGGFQGRPNKVSDTCYAFWIGAVLRILGAHNFIDKGALRGFLLACQSEYGGFGKVPGDFPDLYHSYYGFTAFSLLEEPDLLSLFPELGITGLAAGGV